LGGILQAMVSSTIAMVAYALLVAGVYKVFKIAGDLAEIKDLLRDIKRNTQDPVAPGNASSVPQSHEELLRALESR
jgi:hypothetical protein